MKDIKATCGHCGADLSEGPNWTIPGTDTIRREACPKHEDGNHPEWITVNYDPDREPAN